MDLALLLAYHPGLKLQFQECLFAYSRVLVQHLITIQVMVSAEKHVNLHLPKVQSIKQVSVILLAQSANVCILMGLALLLVSLLGLKISF